MNIALFDFDGTIVDLEVNWKSLKKELNSYCKTKSINLNLTIITLDLKLDNILNYN